MLSTWSPSFFCEQIISLPLIQFFAAATVIPAGRRATYGDTAFPYSAKSCKQNNLIPVVFLSVTGSLNSEVLLPKRLNSCFLALSSRDQSVDLVIDIGRHYQSTGCSSRPLASFYIAPVSLLKISLY